VNVGYEGFREALLSWFEREGRRLPWRETTDPYRIWTAEVILQQTQVGQAEGYLKRFWMAFPTLEALAKAPREAVLAVWQGLGYYQRAHNLHEAAQVFLRMGGIPLSPWPEALRTLEEIPGIGPYTARAILAFAGGAPLLPVDGNLVRVLSRLWGESVPAQRRAYYQAKADALPPSFTGRRVGFALMDLAQLLCRPQQPNCLRCPLQTGCQAHRLSRPEAYPPKLPRPERPTRYFRMLLYYTPLAVWLTQRPSKGLWGGLWTPPLEEISEAPLRPPDIRHTFTHFQMLAFTEELTAPYPHTQPIPWTELPHYGLPAPIRRYLTLLYQRLL
jgi:A/G-specific adenine glycosylase